MKTVSWAGLLLAVGLMATGCGAATTSTASAGGSGTTTAAGRPASDGSTSAAATEAATTGSGTSGSSSGPSPCRSADLQASLGGGAGAGMSQNRLGLQLRNVGSAPCTLYGYPGVSWVAGSKGQQVGAAASRQPDNGSAEKVITLAPGALASAPIDIVAAAVIPTSECKPVPVRGLRVYPPGERAALFIPDSGHSGQDLECSQVTKQPTLLIGYLQAGAQPGGELFVEALSPPDGPAPTYAAMFKYNVDRLVAGMKATAKS